MVRRASAPGVVYLTDMTHDRPHDGPLLVYGPRSLAYDFGDHHPLTPRRFGPGIDLLRAVGAVPGLAPEPASDEDLRLVHSDALIECVRRFGADPTLPPAMGVGISDNPAFAGMHEAGATVAGGSIAAVESILQGDVLHAHHPGGGLHHAMADRVSGFCIYDDVALAVARARASGLRVLYVDLDVHHGDGVQATFYRDPGALTISFHESGAYLFPGTGFVDELGDGAAAGTSVNVPFEPYTGETVWLPAVRSLVPLLAAAFGPDLVVSQHGADSHAWDPLAHLRVTTTAMGEAARVVDAAAHRWAAGRWLATGGGGYDAYRVVPRAWALTWLAGAHREPPAAIPEAWRERWAGEGVAYGQAPPPERFDDPPNAGAPVSSAQETSERRSAAVVALVRDVVVPRLLREAGSRGWWEPAAPWPPDGAVRADLRVPAPVGEPVIVDVVDRPALERLTLAPRVVAPADPGDARELLLRALAEPGVTVTAAVEASLVVGLAVSAAGQGPGRELLALGVAPGRRSRGLGRALLRRHVAAAGASVEWAALVTVAERDVVEPLPVNERSAIARRLLDGAGFRQTAADPAVVRVDRSAVAGVRGRARRA